MGSLITDNCSVCFRISRADCDAFTVGTGLSDGSYTLMVENRNGVVKTDDITISSGDFIFTVDNFPVNYFNPYTEYTVIISDDGSIEGQQELTIDSNTYQCIRLSFCQSCCEVAVISSGDGIIYLQHSTSSELTTSVIPFDEAAHIAVGTYDFNPSGVAGILQQLDYNSADPYHTLLYANAFGNKNRFTDRNGLQIYGDNYGICNLTGFGFGTQDTTIHTGVISLANILTAVDGLSFAGFDDWRVFTIQNYSTLGNINSIRWYRDAPFAAGNTNMASNSINGQGGAMCASQNGLIGSISTASSARSLIIRTHFTVS